MDSNDIPLARRPLADEFIRYQSVNSTAAVLANWRERGKPANALWWHRFVPAHKSVRNEPNKSECSPTTDHSKIYGSGHLTRAFCDNGRIFS